MLQIGSPPPTLACPYTGCLRHFHSKGGCTKHIQVKHHANEPNPHVSNLTIPPSPVPSSYHSSSHNVQFEWPPNPISSDFTPSSPSCGEVDNFSNIGIDAEYPQFDQDYIPPDLNIGDNLTPPRDNPMEQQHAPSPNAPHITYIYHPKLDGKLDHFYHTPALIITVFRKICDENGKYIPFDTPPCDLDLEPHN